MLNHPKEIFVGNTSIPHMNYVSEKAQMVFINEESVYIGILPLRLSDLGQAKKAALRIYTYSEHLAILFSSFEGWSGREFTYEQIIETSSGFIFEIHPANDFESFSQFREWLLKSDIKDDYYADMRTVTYQREGLKLSACYSPYQSAFRYVTVNDEALYQPILSIEGVENPGYDMINKSKDMVGICNGKK